MPAAPPLPDHPEPVNGYWTSRRAEQRARRRAVSTGTWLQRGGAVIAAVLLVWFTVGDDVVSRWRQHDLRAGMLEQFETPADPSSLPSASPAFGLGGTPGQAAPITLVQIPGEEVGGAPDEPEPPAPAPAADISFRMRADKIGLDWVVGSGVDVPDLKAGPGWMPGTAAPGAAGNTVISGHRTTYGAPFNRIDELELGDEIVLDLPGGGQAVYAVRDRFVVTPKQVDVVLPAGGSRLTLTTCTPTGKATYRLIVQAEQVSGPAVDAGQTAEWVPYAGERIDDPELRR